MTVVLDFSVALYLCVEIGLLIFLGRKAFVYKRREHLLWIGIMLCGRLVSLASVIFYMPVVRHPPIIAIRSILMAVTWVGRCIDLAGFVAMVITMSRLISRSEATADRTPSDPGAWPPPPRS